MLKVACVQTSLEYHGFRTGKIVCHTKDVHIKILLPCKNILIMPEKLMLKEIWEYSPNSHPPGSIFNEVIPCKLRNEPQQKYNISYNKELSHRLEVNTIVLIRRESMLFFNPAEKQQRIRLSRDVFIYFPLRTIVFMRYLRWRIEPNALEFFPPLLYLYKNMKIYHQTGFCRLFPRTLVWIF